MALPLLLILEDVAEMREWIAALVLERFPAWKVQTAGDPMAFHRSIDRERPTLVLLDEVLGAGEDVASLLQVLRERQIPAALMTGMSPGHRSNPKFPADVLNRLTKPTWATEAGTEEFLAELDKVMILTFPGRIG